MANKQNHYQNTILIQYQEILKMHIIYAYGITKLNHFKDWIQFITWIGVMVLSDALTLKAAGFGQPLLNHMQIKLHKWTYIKI